MNPVINKPDVFLIKEFKDLFDEQHCKGIKGDPNGKMKLKALYELTYIYLMYDWKTPYSEYSIKERKEAALLDSNVQPEWLEDEKFKIASKKYQDLQDSRILRLLNSAYKAVDELRLYFDTLDITEKDMQGKPMYSTKNIMMEIASLGKTVEGLQQLQFMVMKEREKTNDLRGSQEPGLFD
jgi:hypothetical protein